MGPISALPEDLLEILLATSTPLASTARRFLAAIPDPAEHFPRALEILGVVEGNTTSPTVTSETNSDVVTPGFSLNAEYVLYWLYREFGVRKNPFLTHWIEICRDGIPGASSSNKGKQKEGEASPESDDLTAKANLRLVYGILAGDAERIGTYTPEEIYSNLDAFLPYKTVDISSLELQTDSALSESDALDAEVRDDHTSLSNLSGLLAEASTRTLSTFERRQLEKFPEKLPLVDVISSELLGGLISHNPSVATTLVTSILSNGIGMQDGSDVSTSRESREGLLSNILPRLEVELSNLEFLTKTIETTTNAGHMKPDEYRHMLHLFLANAVRRTDMLDNNPGRNDNEYVNIAKGGHRVVFEGSIGGSDGGRGRQAQARNIRLLCLFIENLLRKEFVSPEEYFYEIQDVGVRYIWVKEARALWMKVNGNETSRGG